MAHVVVLGAGLGGTIMAYEMKDALRPQDTLTVVNRGSTYSFVPSNPWVAVGWREKEEIEVDLAPVFERRGIAFRPDGAVRLHPETNSIEMGRGDTLTYDYLVIATGPELAFDEIEGLGPHGNTHSVCHVDHALKAKDAFETLASRGGRSSSARRRAHPASGRPTSSRSSSRRRCAAARSATVSP